MPRRLIDVTGQIFGQVQAVEHLGKGHWLCTCLACGREDYIVRNSMELRRAFAKGRTCGCRRSEFQAQGKTEHGEAYTVEYRTWKSMIARCEIPSSNNYDRYGGRGIKVCAKWRHDYPAFLKDMGRRPSAKHSIERRDVDGNYEPNNCYWATDGEQSRNRSDNRLITFQGRTQILNDWVAETGIGRGVIRRRLAQGWSIERALTEPVQHIGRWHGNRKAAA